MAVVDSESVLRRAPFFVSLSGLVVGVVEAFVWLLELMVSPLVVLVFGSSVDAVGLGVFD